MSDTPSSFPPPDLPPPSSGPGSSAPPAPPGSSSALSSSGAPSVASTASTDNTLAMLCHLLAIFSGFLAPLIIWLLKRDESAVIDHHGKESLNFQITLLICWAVALVSILILVGLLLLPVVFVISVVFPILASMSANRGELYRYPFSLRIIK